MKEHMFLADKLDVVAFARDGGQLSGELPAGSLLRLADAAAPEAPASAWPAVKWSATGERREPRGAQAQTWLHLEASAVAQLTCQRCLRPVQEHIEFTRWFRFVQDEAAAAGLDAECEEDLLVISRSFDVLELIEDELLLTLPLVPRHEQCPEPLKVPVDPSLAAVELEVESPHPFAALAALKKQGPAQ
ncbi:YceD family protein [Roseateles oligotrophus]|uniref:Large ribosomal RNA subunit accumulation protein YceD n=1 Tax=Roseateles oligotrophus TaxID=1769250 RepID=A0ABT2YIJ7_9BURK|nr:DUF177 domain-containing protein [Roseateles oligotrophus]MCV2369892.1 DUF177 domain-containing protein [Roseateles oligotrophus]